MPRNYAKEMEWQKSKYTQVGFMADKAVVEAHRAHLAENGIRPIDWFRYAVSLGLVPPGPGAAAGAAGVTINGVPVAAFADDGGPAVADGGGTGGMVVREVAVSVAAFGPAKVRKRRMPKPSAKLVREWRAMREAGMTFAKIAEASGYELSTVRKRLLM